jgi:MFS family permease
MRGRYMAVAGVNWAIPRALGPLAAGLIMDNHDPNWVWYAAGILGAVAAAGYGGMHLRVGDRLKKRTDPSSPQATLAPESDPSDWSLPGSSRPRR